MGLASQENWENHGKPYTDDSQQCAVVNCVSPSENEREGMCLDKWGWAGDLN